MTSLHKTKRSGRVLVRTVSLTFACALFIWALQPILEYRNFVENPSFQVAPGESFPFGWHYTQPYGSNAPFQQGSIRTNAAGLHRYYRELTITEPGEYELVCTYRTITSGTWPASVQIQQNGRPPLLSIPLGYSPGLTSISKAIRFEEVGSYTVSLGTDEQGINGELTFSRIEIKPLGSIYIEDSREVVGLFVKSWKCYVGVLLLVIVVFDLRCELRRAYRAAVIRICDTRLKYAFHMGALCIVLLCSSEFVPTTSLWDGFNSLRSFDSTKDRFFNELISRSPARLLSQVVVVRNTGSESVIFDEAGMLPSSRVVYLPFLHPRLIVRWEGEGVSLPKGFDPDRDLLFRDRSLAINYVLTDSDRLKFWMDQGSGEVVYRRNPDYEVYIDDIVVSVDGKEIFRESFEGEEIPELYVRNLSHLKIGTQLTEKKSYTGEKSFSVSVENGRPWSELTVFFQVLDRELRLSPDFQISYNYWTNQPAALRSVYLAVVGTPGAFGDNTISQNPSYMLSTMMFEWGTASLDANSSGIQGEFMDARGYKWEDGVYLSGLGFRIQPVESRAFILWKLDEPLPVDQLEDRLAMAAAGGVR